MKSTAPPVAEELTARIGALVAEEGATDPLGALRAGVAAWLELEVQRIVLLDAPSVLGWERYREIGMRYAVGLVEGVLEAAMEAGQVSPRPVRPLAHLLVGAMEEGALFVARAPDPVAARRDVEATLGALVSGLLAR